MEAFEGRILTHGFIDLSLSVRPAEREGEDDVGGDEDEAADVGGSTRSRGETVVFLFSCFHHRVDHQVQQLRRTGIRNPLLSSLFVNM